MIEVSLRASDQDSASTRARCMQKGNERMNPFVFFCIGRSNSDSGQQSLLYQRSVSISRPSRFIIHSEIGIKTVLVKIDRLLYNPVERVQSLVAGNINQILILSQKSSILHKRQQSTFVKDFDPSFSSCRITYSDIRHSIGQAYSVNEGRERERACKI